MANFKVHLVGATLASGAAATAATAVGLTGPEQTPALFALGIGGGLLPDIDADNSTPVRLAFSLLGLIAAFVAVFHALEHTRFSIAELCLLGAGTFAVVRYAVFELFLRLTEHRGVFHSLLAAVFFALATAGLAFHLLGAGPRLAWLHGLFLGLGYLVHLILDELYSVDLFGRRLKRSFGTALKPASRDLRASLLLGLLTLGVWTAAPPPAVLYRLLSQNHLWQPIRQRLWPDHGVWFAELRRQVRIEGGMLIQGRQPPSR